MGRLYIDGISVTIIICWIKRIVFKPSKAFAESLAVFLIELCIGGVIWVVQEFLRTKKEMRLTKSVLSFAIALVLLVGFLYIKYNF